jgi:hypothetical protein
VAGNCNILVAVNMFNEDKSMEAFGNATVVQGYELCR